MKKMVDPPEKKHFKMWRIHISQNMIGLHVRGDSVVHDVLDSQMKKMISIAETAIGVNIDNRLVIK